MSDAKKARYASSSSDDSEGEVVELSCNQRQPKPGEPVCVVCGRYGAYICQTYEVDVCSVECKAVHAAQHHKSDLQHSLASQAKRVIPATHSLPKLSDQQRLALPQETQCSCCKTKLGVSPHLDQGLVVCSEECRDTLLTPDIILQSPRFSLHPEIATLSKLQLLQITQTLDLRISEGDAPPVILDFKHAPLHEKLLDNIHTLGYKLPTAVQSQVIPAVLDGSDVLVCSGTGSGKTASYLVPLIHRVSYWSSHITSDKILAVIMVPTRELAIQVERVAKSLGEGVPWMRTALVVGGLSRGKQEYRLGSGVQVVIGTPGRLADVAPDLSSCCMLVLDECDVLLDPSFHEQVKRVIRRLPTRHQTLMCSATLHPDTRKHAKLLLYHPVVVQVGKQGDPADSVKQIFIWVENDGKKKKLLSILADERFNTSPLVVFVESKFAALLLADFLIHKDILCGVMHGDKTQEDRIKITTELETGKYSVLVSTNILGRGLDFPSVSQVVLFDLPKALDVYIHQVGRAFTRRCPGTALVFVNNSDKSLFLQLYELSASGAVKLPHQLLNSQHLAYQKQNKVINQNMMLRTKR